MGLKYKIDILERLKEAGYTSYRLRRERLMSEFTVQSIRDGVGISWSTLETLCRLLDCQPGDLVEYTPDEDQKD